MEKKYIYPGVGLKGHTYFMRIKEVDDDDRFYYAIYFVVQLIDVLFSLCK
jgi:hypothetical protein